MARIENTERQAEKDRAARLKEVEMDKEAKLASQVKLEK